MQPIFFRPVSVSQRIPANNKPERQMLGLIKLTKAALIEPGFMIHKSPDAVIFPPN